MNTVLKDWYIVSVLEGDELVGKVLYGTVIFDSSFRYIKGDYVCTSKIVDINVNNQLIKTHSGSLYQIHGNGKRAKIKFNEFELLRQGFSPDQIIAIRQSPKLKVH